MQLICIPDINKSFLRRLWRLLTPAFGITEAYGDDIAHFNNAVGFFMIWWTVFVFTFHVSSLPNNIAHLLVSFGRLRLPHCPVAASYFAKANGHAAAVVVLQNSSGVFCFLAGSVGWYIVFHLLLQDSLLDLSLGETSIAIFWKEKEESVDWNLGIKLLHRVD